MPNRNQLQPEDIGRDLGTESTAATLEKVERYCDLEVEKINLANEPRILALRHEGAILVEEEEELRVTLQDAPRPGSLRSRKWRALYYWTVAALLSFAGFCFLIYTFAPYRIGRIGILYCLGAAAVVPFLLDLVLQNPARRKVFETLATIALIAGITSLMLLAFIRGDLLTQELQSSGPAVVFDDVQPAAETPAPETNFYDKTRIFLRIALVLLAFAMDVGAGLALREAKRAGSEDSEDWASLRHRRDEVDHRLIAIASEIRALENAGQAFAKAFWADFYKAMITHTLRSAAKKFLLSGIILLTLLTPRHALAASQKRLVIAVDLTQSVAIKDASGKTEFEKNIDAVSRLLSRIDAGSHVTIIGITDRSFMQPDILLSATVPDDPGYFGERVQRARTELLKAWKIRSSQLAPTWKHTDIIGALFLASELLQPSAGGGERTLVILSDMQNNTQDLDLESGTARKSAVDKSIAIADLHGLVIRVAGADAGDKSLTYWESLRNFWMTYFSKAGAQLESYTVIRDVAP